MKKVANDHRSRLTRMLIRNAYTELLRQKPLQSISVKELCEHAGINRGTFYSHYNDIYDLQGSLEFELLNDLTQAMRPILEQNGDAATSLRVTSAIFKYLKENSDMCVATLGEYGHKEFLTRVKKLGHEVYMSMFGRVFANAPKEDHEYFYAFMSSGCIGLLQKWFDDGMTASADKVADIAERLMLYGARILRDDGQDA